MQNHTAQLRQFGLLAGTGLMICGLILWYRYGHRAVLAISCAGALLFLAGLCAPSALSAPHSLFQKFTEGMTRLITNILLVLSFYLIMTPVGALMRMANSDPLQLKLDTSAISYWHRREQGKQPQSADYERQY